MISLIGVASAMSTYEQSISDKMTNIFSKFKYGMTKGVFLFTTWGEVNGCSVNPDWEGWIRGSMSQPTSLPTSVSCSKVGTNKCAIDIWYDNTIYLSGTGPPANVNLNNYLREVSGTGVSFSGTTYPYYYVQIYGCPDTPPVTEDWATDVYRCQLGVWSSKGSYTKTQYCSYDTSGLDLCWCSPESDNFYIDQTGDVHCTSSPSSSWCSTYVAHYVKDCVAGTTESLYWYDSLGARNDLIQSCSSTQTCTLDGCVDNTPTICSSGQTKCESTTYYICTNNAWVSQGQVNGQCGYVSPCISRDQLGVLINNWVAGTITRDSLGQSIQKWSGC